MGVGLGQHRCGCLDQHVVLGQSRALRGNVHVDDPSVGRFQVALLPGHLVGGEAQSGHGCSVVRTQGGNVLHRLSEDSHGDVRQIDRACGILRNEGHYTRIGISLIAHRVVERAIVGSRNTDFTRGDGEGREEQGLVHADLRSGVALRGHDHVHRVVQGQILIEIVELGGRSATKGRGGCEQTDPVELEGSHVKELLLQILELAVVVGVVR